MSDCHFCQKQRPGIFKAKCCKPRCSKNYCIKCIQQQYDQNFQESLYKKDTWICYSCQKRCNCKVCKGIGILALEKKTARKKNNQKAQTQKPQNASLRSCFDQQQLHGLPPYLRKIIQRKRLLYLQTLKQQQKEEAPKQFQKKQENLPIEKPQTSKLKLDQLINNTLKQYEDDDVMEIQQLS